MTAIAPTQSNVLTQLGKFMLAVLPAGTKVVAAQQNRVAEPATVNFVVMTPIRFERIETNIDTYADSKLTGSIAGPTMTITAVDPDLNGAIVVGSQIFGVGVADNTIVTALGSGSGGVGTYTVTPAQTISSETLSAGVKRLEQHAKVTVQLDFHSADLSVAGDMAQTVSTTLRDEYGVRQFAEQVPNYGVVPLYADDPTQRPFFNDQQQVEWRWSLEAMLQLNQMLSVPQQFADELVAEVISVDVEYAP